MRIPTMLALTAALMMGCAEEKGPAERAGEKLDEAVENVQDEAHELGDAIEDAAEDIEDELDGN